MVKCTTIIMAGVTFTGGLLLGLILHLPGASSPHSRHIRSASLPSEITHLNNAAVAAAAMGNPHISSSVGAVRSLLSKVSHHEDINIVNKLSGTGRIFSRHSNKTHGRRHSRVRLNKSNELTDTRDMSFKSKSSKRGYTSSKQAIQYANQNNKHRKGSIQNTPPLLISKSHNKNINISSSYGNERVLDKYHLKQSDKSKHDIRAKVKEKQTNQDEDEIDLKKTLPPAKHTSVDVYDKLQNTQHVEMSVSVIDVATGSKSFKNPSDIITNDRQTMLDVNLESRHATPDHVSNISLHGHFTKLWEIVDGIYWSPQLERLTPKGFSEYQTTKWRQHAQNSQVIDIKEGCGRMQNRLIVFRDGTKMCARYRINTDQIQGEVYSYYLAKTLGIDNVLPPILSKANPTSSQWSSVTNNIDSVQWNSQKLFVLTPWLENLQAAYIPIEYQSDSKQTLSPLSKSLVNKSLDELTELVQWSDLIILDYLTANVDRVVNNMFNLQWNSGMMKAPTHNLERLGQSGPLVFLDNESGLLHSYRLLDKYSHYHEQLLRSICVFRKSTAEHIKNFFQNGDITQKLKAKFQSTEPFSSSFAFIPQQNLSVLSQRLGHIYRQIISCERNYAKNTS